MNSEAQARRSEQENEEETLVNRQPANQSSAGSPDYLQSNQPGLKQEPDSQKYGVELKYRSVENVSAGKLAAGLGYFSIALGLAELLAPAQLGEIIGLDKKHRSFLPLLGLREIAHGVAILSQPKPTAGVTSRIAGDAIDLAFLGSAFMSENTVKSRLAAATAAVLGVGALDVMCARQLSSQDWGDDKNPLAPTTVGQPSGRISTSG